MASIDTHRAPAEARPLGFGFMSVLNGWLDARQTRKALHKLSDHELDDIGLCRGDIDRVARSL